MKYIFWILMMAIGAFLGYALQKNVFEGYLGVVFLFVIFPALVIFGTIFIGLKKKPEKDISKEIKKQDRFTKWD